MTLTHAERIDVYAVAGEAPLSGEEWEREIIPQQIKVTLRPAGDGTWSAAGVGVHGPYTEADDMPGAQRCRYYSGDRLKELPDVAQDAVDSSLRLANQF